MSAVRPDQFRVGVTADPMHEVDQTVEGFLQGQDGVFGDRNVHDVPLQPANPHGQRQFIFCQ